MNNPDAVLLDLGLRGFDGYEVGRRLREVLGQHPVLIAMSGDPIDVQRCRSAGIDLHMHKPVDPEEVERLLTRLHHWASPETKKVLCQLPVFAQDTVADSRTGKKLHQL